MDQYNYVYLGIRGDFNCDEFAAWISTSPSRCTKKHSLGPLKNHPKTSSLRYGQIHSGTFSTVSDFYDMADQVVELLKPHVDGFKNAIKHFDVRPEFQFVVSIDSTGERATPILGLSNKAIKFIAELNASLDIDSYLDLS